MPNNLLSKENAPVLSPNAWLYIVQDGQDFRVQASRIASLVTPASIGLGNVNNTSDQDKPISLQTQAALTALSGAVAQKAESVHTHTADQITDLLNFLNTQLFPDQEW